MKALIPLLVLLAGTAQAADRVERGRYLVNTSGCMDCHTPLKMGAHGPEPDMARLLSGHPQELVITAPVAAPAGPWMAVTAVTATAFSGPWGVSFTANLTPDVETAWAAGARTTSSRPCAPAATWAAAAPCCRPCPSPSTAR